MKPIDHGIIQEDDDDYIQDEEEIGLNERTLTHQLINEDTNISIQNEAMNDGTTNSFSSLIYKLLGGILTFSAITVGIVGCNYYVNINNQHSRHILEEITITDANKDQFQQRGIRGFVDFDWDTIGTGLTIRRKSDNETFRAVQNGLFDKVDHIFEVETDRSNPHRPPHLSANNSDHHADSAETDSDEDDSSDDDQNDLPSPDSVSQEGLSPDRMVTDDLFPRRQSGISSDGLGSPQNTEYVEYGEQKDF